MRTRHVAAWLVGALLLGCDAPATLRPNIVLIIGDDHAYPDAGFMGSKVARTPNLDRLAAEGTVFTTAYNTSSVCRPSLLSLLTGLQPYPASLWLGRLERRGLARRAGAIRYLDTLPGLLKSRGYRSFQAGKLWEGSRFEEAGFTAGTKTGAPGGGPMVQLVGGESGLQVGRTTMAPVFEFLRDAAGEPFFLWFAPMLPHRPFDAPPEARARYEGERLSESALGYYANVSRLDDAVGDLLDELDTREITDRTLVVYLSDNGWDPSGDLDVGRGRELGGVAGKMSMHELGFRTPMVFRWPGRVPAGVVRDDLVSTLDLFPTLLDYAGDAGDAGDAGAARPPGREGIDLRAAVEHGAALPARTLYGWMEHALPSRIPPTTKHWRAQEREAFFARSPRWHYIHFPARADDGGRAQPAEAELYDLRADPAESRNVAAAFPQELRSLAAGVERWRLQALARLPEKASPEAAWRDPARAAP